MGRALVLCICVAVVFAMSDEVRPPLTNEDVITLVTAGFGEPLILQAIGINPNRFDLSPAALVLLQKAGVSDLVIAGMRGTRVQRHLRLLEPGVYVKRGDVYALVEAESVTWQSRSTDAAEGKLTRLTLLGTVPNRNSHLRLSGPAELLLVPPAGAFRPEYQILRAEETEDAREFRAEAAARQEILLGIAGKPAVVVPLDRTFDLGVRVLLGSLHKGEYGLVACKGPFSREARIYTFSIE